MSLRNKQRLLSRRLDLLCRYLNKEFDINLGGCCYVASVIAYLLERENIPYKVVVYGCDEKNFSDIDCSKYHYALIVRGWIINKSGCRDGKIFTGVASSDLVTHYEECFWNSSYDTKQNPFIEYVITAFYDQFIKNIF